MLVMYFIYVYIHMLYSFFSDILICVTQINDCCQKKSVQTYLMIFILFVPMLVHLFVYLVLNV